MEGAERHTLMTMMAYAFLQTRRLALVGRKKGAPGHRLSPACRQSGKLSLSICHAHRLTDALIAGGGATLQKTKLCQSSDRSICYRGATARSSYRFTLLTKQARAFCAQLAHRVNITVQGLASNTNVGA